MLALLLRPHICVTWLFATASGPLPTLVHDPMGQEDIHVDAYGNDSVAGQSGVAS
jgi:hypothetical protein